MKVVILHDFIKEMAGTERFLFSLLKIFPSAEVCTLIYDKSQIKIFDIHANKIKTSFINKIPILNKKTSIIQILSPFLWSTFNLDGFDLVISSSTTGLSSLVNTGNIPHIIYINSIPKNLFYRKEHLLFQKLIPFHIIYSNLYNSALHSSRYLLTNSLYMQRKLHKMFGVTAKVIYPPVHIPKGQPKRLKGEYFLYVGRIDKNKSIDLAIHACNYLNLPFKVIGIGPELNNLRKIAGPTVKFLGFIPDEKLPYYYQKAKAFIFCAKDEEFGIAPIEAMAHGVPVIAYCGGGTKETVKENVTGNYFYRHNTEMLMKTLLHFQKLYYNPKQLYIYSKKFSEKKFIDNIRNYVKDNLWG